MRADYLTRFKNLDNIELAEKVMSVRLPVEIDAAVRTLPSLERSKWLRRVITDAAKSELMGNDGS